MKTIVARTKPLDAYDTLEQAIAAGKKMDRDYRTVLDEQVRGKSVRAIRWSDQVIALELDTDQWLNVEARTDGVACSLANLPAVSRSPCCSDEVRLILGTHTFAWPRHDIAQRYTGKSMERLWFAADNVLLYFKDMPILSCHLIFSEADGSPLILWERSD